MPSGYCFLYAVMLVLFLYQLPKRKIYIFVNILNKKERRYKTYKLILIIKTIQSETKFKKQ